MNSLKALHEKGHSIWLDYLRRFLLTGGELKRLVKENKVRGVIINLKVFEKAVAGSSDYDVRLRSLIASQPNSKPKQIYEILLQEDVTTAADILRSVYDKSSGKDGYVSICLSPELAHSAEASIEQARELWKRINRPNLMIDLPATREGIQALRVLVSEGINVNAKLIFSPAQYEAAAQAYLSGVEEGKNVEKVSSFASIHLSPLERAVEGAISKAGDKKQLALSGKITPALALVVYRCFREIFGSLRWHSFAAQGAKVQRLLWTDIRNDISVSSLLLIGGPAASDAAAAISPAALLSTREETDLQVGAEELFEALTDLNIDLNSLGENLQEKELFSLSSLYHYLLENLEKKKANFCSGIKGTVELSPGKYRERVESRLKKWEKDKFSRRLWEKDPTLWFRKKTPEIADRLGWIMLPESMSARVDDFIFFAQGVKNEGFRRVILLGMGGSSLAPEVFQKVFGSAPGFPRLTVLDTTHPSALSSLAKKLDLAHTLFIVSSKSGTTLETLSLFRYFWKRVSEMNKLPGKNFIAISDPGSPLIRLAEERNFRKIFTPPPDVGGRYSALTDFGLLPAAILGINIEKLLDNALLSSENCAFCVPEKESSGLSLGALLGVTARERDKLTIITSPSIQSFSDWLEQLMAESTGKEGRGIVPITHEPVLDISLYGNDRLFLFIILKEDESLKLEKIYYELKTRGNPAVKIMLRDKYEIGREIFRWEVAVSSAGTVLGIHPFNQPDVQLTKDFTREIMENRDKREAFEGTEAKTFSITSPNLPLALKKWLSSAGPNDFVAIQAFLAPEPRTTEALQELRLSILEKTHLATTSAYGPRFLHSTGQLHKGGPSNGLFLQLFDEPEEKIPVPETDYTFAQLISAQCLGDYQALIKGKKRVLRIKLEDNIVSNLMLLSDIITTF